MKCETCGKECAPSAGAAKKVKRPFPVKKKERK